MRKIINQFIGLTFIFLTLLPFCNYFILDGSEVENINEVNSNLDIHADVSYQFNRLIRYKTADKVDFDSVYNNDEYIPELRNDSLKPDEVFKYSDNRDNASLRNRNLSTGDYIEVGVLVSNPSKDSYTFDNKKGTSKQSVEDVLVTINYGQKITFDDSKEPKIYKLSSNGGTIEQLKLDKDYTTTNDNNNCYITVKELDVDEQLYIYSNANVKQNNKEYYDINVLAATELDNASYTATYKNESFVNDFSLAIDETEEDENHQINSDETLVVNSSFELSNMYLLKDFNKNDSSSDKIPYSIFELSLVDNEYIDSNSISNIKINGIDYKEYLKQNDDMKAIDSDNIVLYNTLKTYTYEVSFEIKTKDIGKDDELNLQVQLDGLNRKDKVIYSFKSAKTTSVTEEQEEQSVAEFEGDFEVVDNDRNGILLKDEYLNYSFTLTNTSNFYLDDVLISSDMENNPYLDPKSVTNLKIDGHSSTEDIVTGVLVLLKPNQNLDIEFQVKINGEIEDEIISNTMIVETGDDKFFYDVTISENEQPFINSSLTVKDEDGDNLISKGENINYVLKIVNPTAFDVNNIFISDDFSSAIQVDTKSISSVSVDDKETDNNIIEGFNYDVKANSIVYISYSAKLYDDEILNGEDINNFVKIAQDGQNIKYINAEISEKSVQSKELNVDVNVDDKKGNNNMLADENEVLTYHYTISNNSDKSLLGLSINTNFNEVEQLDYKNVSNLLINDKYSFANLNKGLTVDIPINDSVTISYDVLVESPSSSKLISNTLSINDGTQNYRSVSTITEAPHSLFKVKQNNFILILSALLLFIVISLILQRRYSSR